MYFFYFIIIKMSGNSVLRLRTDIFKVTAHERIQYLDLYLC
jgi:hypothetical protein